MVHTCTVCMIMQIVLYVWQCMVYKCTMCMVMYGVYIYNYVLNESTGLFTG